MKCAPKTTFFPEDQLRRKNPEDELLPEDEFPEGRGLNEQDGSVETMGRKYNGRKRRAEARGTPRRIGNGRVERKGKKIRSNERDEKEMKRKEGSNEWKGGVETKGRTQ